MANFCNVLSVNLKNLLWLVNNFGAKIGEWTLYFKYKKAGNKDFRHYIVPKVLCQTSELFWQYPFDISHIVA